MMQNAAALGGESASRVMEEAAKIPDAHPDAPRDPALTLMHLLFS